MNITIQSYISASAAALGLLLLLFLLPACSDEGGSAPEVPEIEYARLTVTLGSLSNAEPLPTRAVSEDGYAPNDIINPDSADQRYEHHIDDWYIIVVKADGDVVDRVVTNNTDVKEGEQSLTPGNNEDEDSNTRVDMELVVGERYRFYALANLKGLTGDSYQAVITALGELKGKEFQKNFRHTAATLREMEVYTASLHEYKTKMKGAYIPMSSYGVEHTVTKPEVSNNNQIRLQLIRLIGKVHIEVTNATGVPLTVNQIKMGKFRTRGSQYLLPYDAAERDPEKPNLLVTKGEEPGLLNPSFPVEGTSADWSYSPKEGETGGTIEAAEEQNTQAYCFYINETNQASVDPKGGDMTVALDVTGEGVEKDSEPKSTRFFFLRRNDLLKVPILVSKVDMKLSVSQQHMPIGGLPIELFYGEGAIVNNKTVRLTHAGQVKISYEIEKVNGEAEGWSLKYYDDTFVRGEKFCCAEVANNEHHLLLVPEQPEGDNSWVGLPWLGNGKYGYRLHSEEGNTLKGSFTINVQELAKGTATIKLTLVVAKEQTTVVLPYTLTIQYGTTNEEGGNV